MGGVICLRPDRYSLAELALEPVSFDIYSDFSFTPSWKPISQFHPKLVTALKPAVGSGFVSKPVFGRERAGWCRLGWVMDWLTGKGLAFLQASYSPTYWKGLENAKVGSELLCRLDLTTWPTGTPFLLSLLPCTFPLELDATWWWTLALLNLGSVLAVHFQQALHLRAT